MEMVAELGLLLDGRLARYNFDETRFGHLQDKYNFTETHFQDKYCTLKLNGFKHLCQGNREFETKVQ